MKKALLLALCAFFMLPLASHAATTQPVIIYTVQTSSSNDGSRLWVTLDVYKKTGNAQPVRLATVGKVGEYPTDFVLSPHHTAMAINLEKKIELLNIATKEIKTIATAKYQFSSMSFAADGQQLVVMDNVVGNAPFALRSFNLKDGNEKTIKSGLTTDFTKNAAYLFAAWRNANTILVTQGCGDAPCSGHPWYVDTTTGKISTAPTYAAPTPFADVVTSYTADGCNQFSGVTANGVKFLSVSTGKQIGSLYNKNWAIAVDRFSPDLKQVLFYNTAIAPSGTNPSDCPAYPKRYYFTMAFAGHVVTKISDLPALLRSWNADDTGATVQHKTIQGKETWQIFRGNTIILTSTKGLEVRGQFWQ